MSAPGPDDHVECPRCRVVVPRSALREHLISPPFSDDDRSTLAAWVYCEPEFPIRVPLSVQRGPMPSRCSE